ncbi:MAG: hypothetical protein KC931_20095 [Candidatus Omnitrophica bacterium]|nr:hypothetical protein [Candidatus Omnitrophota bacterium]
MIASLAGDWRLTTTGWEFDILEDGRVNAERQTGRIEVIDLDQRIVKMLGFDQIAIWKVSEDLKSMNGTGVKGGSRHPAERR